MKEGFKHTEVGLIPKDWSDKPLGKLCISIASGKSKTQSALGGKYFIYGSTGIIGQCSKPDYEGERILVARVGANAGTVNQVIGEYSVSDNTLMVQLKIDIDFNFVFYFLKYSNLNKLIFGSGQPLITGIQLKNLVIPLPPTKAEQTAIATALNDADALIQKLEQLIAKKRNIKTAAMQQLLKPKEGWEVKKLGEVGKCLRGVSYNADRDLMSIDSDSTIRLLRSNNVQQHIIELNELQFVNNSRVKPIQILLENDIVICMANGSKQLVGKAAQFKVMDNFKYTFGAFMGCFRVYPSDANPTFVFYNFLSDNYRNFIDVLLSGSSINNLKPSDIESINIPFPSIEEQTRIAQILTDMDNEIAALEKQLEKYKMMKQGMMQVLLTGKVRLMVNDE